MRCERLGDGGGGRCLGEVGLEVWVEVEAGSPWFVVRGGGWFMLRQKVVRGGGGEWGGGNI